MQSVVNLFRMSRLAWAVNLLALLSWLSIASVAVAADSSVLPVYRGGMDFPTIHGPADPEEYSWEVKLDDGQELVAIDDQHAEIYYDGQIPMDRIDATPARDANGSQ